MDRLVRGVTAHPWTVLVATAVLTLVAFLQLVDVRTGAVRIALDPSMSRLMPDDDEDRLFYEAARQRFGSDDAIVVALAADPLFTHAHLDAVRRMSVRFAELPLVRGVVSLATALDVRGEGGDLSIEPFFEQVPRDDEALLRIRDRALGNPMYAGNLVSRDGTATAIVLPLANVSERGLEESGLEARVRAIVEEERGDAEVWITGAPIVKSATGRILLEDLRRIIPLAFALAMVVAFLSFRSLRGVLVPMASVSLGIVWTLATMVWLGRPLNVVTVIVPPLLITVGYAYAMHLMTEYQGSVRSCGDRTSRKVVEHALHEVAVPVLVCGLTTAVGFGSLMLSPLSAIREFGGFSVLGTFATVFATLTFAPALLAVLSLPDRTAQTKDGTSLLDRLSERLGLFDVRHHRAIFVVWALVLVLSAIGAARIEVSTDLVKSFPADEPVRRDAEAVNARLDGANSLWVVVEGGEAGAFKDPDNLRALSELSAWLETRPDVGSVTSIADYVMLVNRAFHDDDPAELAIPASKAATAQLVGFADGKELRSLVDARWQSANLLVRSTAADSARVGALVSELEARLADLPQGLRARVTGGTVLITRTIDELTRGQAWSLLTGFVLIYAVLVAMFASLRVGLVALIPNALPVAIYFGAMGFAGIALGTSTGLVACVVLGIAVDDTIHYMHRFSAESRRLGDESRGTVATMRALGRPVTLTAIAACAGFLVLSLSRLSSQREFGQLAAFTLACGWLCEMTLTPALCSVTKIVTLWDVLTLDLGPSPQRTIGIFRDLSERQARIAALMMGITQHPKGTRLFRAGEEGNDMHVVIDGELSASVATGSGVRPLNTMRRGDSVGEVALFHGRRTADVDAVTDVRTVRLTRKDLEALRKRYPRIGAKVFWNLSEILAQRVANTTEKMA